MNRKLKDLAKDGRVRLSTGVLVHVTTIGISLENPEVDSILIAEVPVEVADMISAKFSRGCAIGTYKFYDVLTDEVIPGYFVSV